MVTAAGLRPAVSGERPTGQAARQESSRPQAAGARAPTQDGTAERPLPVLGGGRRASHRADDHRAPRHAHRLRVGADVGHGAGLVRGSERPALLLGDLGRPAVRRLPAWLLAVTLVACAGPGAAYAAWSGNGAAAAQAQAATMPSWRRPHGQRHRAQRYRELDRRHAAGPERQRLHRQALQRRGRGADGRLGLLGDDHRPLLHRVVGPGRNLDLHRDAAAVLVAGRREPRELRGHHSGPRPQHHLGDDRDEPAGDGERVADRLHRRPDRGLQARQRDGNDADEHAVADVGSRERIGHRHHHPSRRDRPGRAHDLRRGQPGRHRHRRAHRQPPRRLDAR